MNMEQLLAAGEERLFKAGIADSKTDAWYLMEHHFHLNRVSFWVNSKLSVEEDAQAGYMDLIEKRAEHIPLQYITGEQEFMGLSFQVNPSVLIPRQDTEVLVEEVLKYCEGKEVLDVCTGSGCIIISLSRLSHLKRGVGLDISPDALETAKKNGEINQTLVQWLESDLFEAVMDKFDIIVSNPPYIESRIVDELMPEVRIHEPRIALDGMEDGLHFYRCITEKAMKYLKKDGAIFFEIGYNQGEAVASLLKEAGFSQVKIIKDLCGLDRVVSGKNERHQKAVPQNL